jgi:uncharacterized RDD family membrane protein YckC
MEQAKNIVSANPNPGFGFVSEDHYDTPQFAGFWIRFVATFLDWLVLFVVYFIVFWVFPASDVNSSALADWMWSLVIPCLYSSILTSSKWQATVGKILVGLKVVDHDHQRISFLRATMRYFANYLSAIILCIGYLMVVWSKNKQALHDMVAGTYVIAEPGATTKHIYF